MLIWFKRKGDPDDAAIVYAVPKPDSKISFGELKSLLRLYDNRTLGDDNRKLPYVILGDGNTVFVADKEPPYLSLNTWQEIEAVLKVQQSSLGSSHHSAIVVSTDFGKKESPSLSPFNGDKHEGNLGSSSEQELGSDIHSSYDPSYDDDMSQRDDDNAKPENDERGGGTSKLEDNDSEHQNDEDETLKLKDDEKLEDQNADASSNIPESKNDNIGQVEDDLMEKFKNMAHSLSDAERKRVLPVCTQLLSLALPVVRHNTKEVHVMPMLPVDATIRGYIYSGYEVASLDITRCTFTKPSFDNFLLESGLPGLYRYHRWPLVPAEDALVTKFEQLLHGGLYFKVYPYKTFSGPGVTFRRELNQQVLEDLMQQNSQIYPHIMFEGGILKAPMATEYEEIFLDGVIECGSFYERNVVLVEAKPELQSKHEVDDMLERINLLHRRALSDWKYGPKPYEMNIVQYEYFKQKKTVPVLGVDSVHVHKSVQQFCAEKGVCLYRRSFREGGILQPFQKLARFL